MLIVAAVVFTRGARLESFDQMAPMLTDALGRWGFPLFVAALGIACFGAALEITLALAYMIAQGFGWSWGKGARPRDAARFSVSYTLTLVLATVLVVVGLDPLRLTNVSMARHHRYGASATEAQPGAAAPRRGVARGSAASAGAPTPSSARLTRRITMS